MNATAPTKWKSEEVELKAVNTPAVADNPPPPTDEDRARWVRQLARVLDERFPKPADDAPEPPHRPAVLLVGADAAELVKLAAAALDPRPWIDYGYRLTCASLTGDAIDLAVYLPDWRSGARDNVTAHAWRATSVRPRFRVKNKAHEIFLG